MLDTLNTNQTMHVYLSVSRTTRAKPVLTLILMYYGYIEINVISKRAWPLCQKTDTSLIESRRFL